MDSETIVSLHSALLNSWNRRDAHAMAALLRPDANLIGFDGSQLNGQSAIEAELTNIFNNHQTAPYVWKVEEVRFLTSDCALLRAIVGMVPPGKDTVNPAVNAIQSLIAIKEPTAKEPETWKIALFQNTPAQLHGRPQLVENMTQTLNSLLTQRSS
ncbi:MAG: SgcJ/EcaC family oxidoreductase [Bacteroidetes bacterium]|nr:SgcJ/EcaC family oxidoreductase [Bacteroidota bacterium]